MLVYYVHGYPSITNFRFTQDTNTYGINDQFLWGPAFMISPVLDQVHY